MHIWCNYKWTKCPHNQQNVRVSTAALRFLFAVINPSYQFSYLSWCFMQAVIWFLARWSCTYLMSPEGNRESNSKNVLLGFFGQHNQGKFVLDIIVRISLTTLASYPGEKDLQVCATKPFSWWLFLMLYVFLSDITSIVYIHTERS